MDSLAEANKYVMHHLSDIILQLPNPVRLQRVLIGQLCRPHHKNEKLLN